MGATVRTATIDWPSVVSEIYGAGVMKKAIARKVGIAPSTLGILSSGLTAEPPYSVGVRLLRLRDRIAAMKEDQ